MTINAVLGSVVVTTGPAKTALRLYGISVSSNAQRWEVPMNRRAIIELTAAVMVLTAVAARTLWPNRCNSLADGDKTRLTSFIKAKYRLSAGAQIAVLDSGPVSGSCFHKLVFGTDYGRRPFRVELFATPDFHFLTGELMNARVDPKELARQRRELAASLVHGALPTRGPENAPATFVVFSDFQCPYCAQMAKTLNDLSVSEGERMRTVYHYFPLTMHRWARPAAEAAACAQQHGNEAFWSLHDFLFAHQGQLSVDNLKQQIRAWASSEVTSGREEFETCLKEGRTSGQVEQELAFGQETGVHSTPTLFVNGELVDGASPEQLRLLIQRVVADKTVSRSAMAAGSSTSAVTRERR
jgi:protein-disulfide isomerase